MRADRTAIAAALLRNLLLLLAVAVGVFLLLRALPGDVVDTLAAEGDLDEDAKAALRTELGLDRPLAWQFFAWAGRALHGDLGESLRFHQPVADMLADALPTTLGFAARALGLGLSLGVALSVLAILRPRPFAAIVQALNVWSIALPSFCVGLAGILVFSVWLHWLPAHGGMLVPVIVVALDIAGHLAKPLTAELQELVTAPFISHAHARGLHPLRVVLKHLLANAAPVALSLAGLIVSGLLAGTLTMEVLFNLPGLGMLALQAIEGRDSPIVQAVILVCALSVVGVNAGVDLAMAVLDPRSRT